LSAIQTDRTAPALVRAIEANTIGYYLNYRRFAPTEIHDEPGLLWFSTGLALPEFNGVLRTELSPTEADARIAATLAQFERRRLPLIWHLGPSAQPVDLPERLLAHGLTHYEDEPGMAADLQAIDETSDAPPGLRIQPVADEAAFRLWLRVWGYEAPDAALELYFTLYAQLGLGAPQPLQHYLGWLDNAPVATAALFYDAGVVSVQHVVTLPAARRRGIGAAMTLHMLRLARAAGYRIATLTASPLGLNTYRRLGFREYCLFRRYLWQPAPAAE
jgi:ribosomal protein S18 acetylase RimI-like enzyme